MAFVPKMVAVTVVETWATKIAAVAASVGRVVAFEALENNLDQDQDRIMPTDFSLAIGSKTKLVPDF